MTSSEPAISSPSTPSMSLALPASHDQLPLLRALVRTLSIYHALMPDTRSDLLLAVDEATTILIHHALPASAVTSTFHIDTTHLHVRLTATTLAPIDNSTSSFGWFVLRELLDALTVEHTPSPTREHWITTIAISTPLRPHS
ncbi:ATP-binding protein [Rhodococcus cerastii]|nr:ATP-binding protein [Rhodococcus cerastii]